MNRLATLVNEFQNAGEYSIYWNAKNSQGKQLDSGLYLKHKKIQL